MNLLIKSINNIKSQSLHPNEERGQPTTVPENRHEDERRVKP